MLLVLAVRKEEDVVEGYIRRVSYGYIVELRTSTARFADREYNIPTALVYKLVREDARELGRRRQVLPATVCARLED